MCVVWICGCVDVCLISIETKLSHTLTTFTHNDTWGAGTYGLGFWYGSTLVLEDEMSVGDVLIVFFSIIMAGVCVMCVLCVCIFDSVHGL